MPKTTGYSLWLVPDARLISPDQKTDVEYNLRRSMHELADEYKTPIFEPHVTLLGGIDGTVESVHQSVQKLAEKLSPFEVEFEKLGSRGTYFQYLFAEIKQTENIMRANAVAQEIFGLKGTYFPHLSLIYSHFPGKKVSLAELVSRSEEVICVGAKFIAREIELWHTDGEPEDWYRVGVYPFKK